MNQLSRHALFGLVALVGAFALGTVALHRGESINALWIVVAAVSVYLIAYRYYGQFIARTVMKLDANRATPAIVHNDGLDYVPTNKTCCSATTLPPLPAPARWWARCWRLSWAICPACCGFWLAWCLPARCRISWCCLSPPAAMAARWAI